MVNAMTRHGLKLATMWAAAAGLAVAGGTSAVALADTGGGAHSVSQHQVAKQLAAAKAVPNAKPSQAPVAKPSAPSDPAVVTTKGGTERLSCDGSELKLGDVTPANGWRGLLIATPPAPPTGTGPFPMTQLETLFVQWPHQERYGVQVVAHCEGGQPKWTVGSIDLDKPLN